MVVDTVRVTINTSADALGQSAPGWDDLAVALEAPRSAPGPVVSWLRHARPPRSGARVLVATDLAGAVAGVLPLVVSRDRFGFVHYDLPGAGALFGVEPLARPEDGLPVARMLAEAIDDLRPLPDTLAIGSMRPESAWPEALASALAPRYERVRTGSFTSSWIDLTAGFEGWLQRRPSKFVRQLTRRSRRLEERGFQSRDWADASDIIRRLPALRRLYIERQQSRGGTGYLFDGAMVDFVEEMVRSYSGTGRLRLVTLERGGEVAAAKLALIAGGCASSWLSAFDIRLGALGPGFEALAAEVRCGAAHGQRLLDLGAGDEDYKGTIADGTTGWVWERWQRRGLVPLHTPFGLVPRHARTWLRERWPGTGESRSSSAGEVGDEGDPRLRLDARGERIGTVVPGDCVADMVGCDPGRHLSTRSGPTANPMGSSVRRRRRRSP
jgi:CelD/BcsL family acetyltransferase involved in cellulose biosynthesis